MTNPTTGNLNVLILTKHDVIRYGVAEVIQGMAACLHPLGVEVCAYSSDPSAEAGELPGGFPCMHGPLPKPGGWGQRDAVRRIARFVAEHDVRLVHAQGLYRAGHAARLLKKQMGLPYVATSQCDLLDADRLRRRRIRRRYRAILRDADAITHVSRVMADAADRLLDVDKKSTAVPNGTDVTWWRQAEARDGGYALAIGRLVPEKGFGVLVEAWGRLAARGVRTPLVIAGRGPLQETLRRRAEELGLEIVDGFDPHEMKEEADGKTRVYFADFVQGDAKRELFAHCRFVAFPTQPRMPEAFGIVMAEAMAAGKPVVASDLAITREVLRDGAHGLLVPPEDAEKWADAVERLTHDQPLRRQYEQKNITEAQRYDWQTIAAQYAQVYHRVLDRP